MPWQMLVLSLPTENATPRMRAWRALKAAGAAVLRDGVYLLPAADGHAQSLQAVADDVRSSGGEAQLFEVQATDGADYGALFDRGRDFGALLAEIGACRAALAEDTAQQTLKQARKLRKAFEQLVAIDFFAGEAQAQTAAALASLEADAARATAPDEPRAVARRIERVETQQYRNRVWATRRRPWVDRLACAWLIRRFIDPQARFVWLESTRPTAATRRDRLRLRRRDASRHVGARVTFEMLLASFGLADAARCSASARAVHCLDAGGDPGARGGRRSKRVLGRHARVHRRRRPAARRRRGRVRSAAGRVRRRSDAA